MFPVIFRRVTVQLCLFEVQHTTEPEQWATIEELETQAVCVCVLRSERLL